MDFLQILKDSGIPTTQADLEIRWRGIVAGVGSSISNDSAYSPFWRFVTVAVTNPVLWLVNFLASSVLPNLYVKYASGPFLDLLADGVNLQRKLATAVVGSVVFSRTDSGLAITVPAGTVIQTVSIAGVVYAVNTTADVSFSGIDLSVSAPVVGAAVGSAFNLPAGYFCVLPVAVFGVTAAANPVNWISKPGTDVELDSDLRDRVRNQFGTASSFHTDSVYTYLISQFPGVNVDDIWFVHNAPRGPGTANAYVLFDFAAPVADYLLAINQFITDQGMHGHGDDLLVLQLPEVAKDLFLTVWFEQFLTPDQQTALMENIRLFVQAAFRGNKLYSPTLTLPYSRFSMSKLCEEIHDTFAGIHSLKFDSDDIVTDLWVPRLEAFLINPLVTEG